MGIVAVFEIMSLALRALSEGIDVIQKVHHGEIKPDEITPEQLMPASREFLERVARMEEV